MVSPAIRLERGRGRIYRRTTKTATEENTLRATSGSAGAASHLLSQDFLPVMKPEIRL